MRNVLCEHCSLWVDCGMKNGKPHGFCLFEDLFTYTARIKCESHSEGTPLSEEEYETVNDSWQKKLRKGK